jgi:hypothetical protein
VSHIYIPFAASTLDGSFLRSTIVGGRGVGMCILRVDRHHAKFPLVRVYARISVIYIKYMSLADLYHWRLSSGVLCARLYIIIPLN